MIGIGNGWLRNERTCRDHPNYNIIKIGHNTEKSHGVLSRLAITQTPVRNHQVTLVWKALERVKKIKKYKDKKMYWENPNNSSVELGQNTKKSPGDHKRLVVILTSVKDRQLTLKGEKQTKNNKNDDNITIKTWQHWKQHWRIDTTTRRLHRRTRRRTDNSCQKRFWQHDGQQNNNN